MNFLEYARWIFYKTIFSYRKCETCKGSNGHCDKCDKLKKNLYRRDWMRWHQSKWL